MDPNSLARSQCCRNTLIVLLALYLVFTDWAAPCRADEPAPLRGVLVSVEQVTAENLATWQTAGRNGVVLQLDEKSRDRITEAAAIVRRADLSLHYWIEIAHNKRLADAHPEWMASLQGHTEWRRFYPQTPRPADGEVVKNYPWVPILYRESFAAHRARVQELLADLPSADSLFLNGLQGPPSACGCGHSLCRWTADYGPLRTATPLENDAAAKFVAEVKRLAPKSQVVPVWVTECEAHDGAADGWCAGVGCFKGICWRAFSQQLLPIAADNERLGVLALYKEFDRDLPRYGDTGAWVATALKSFSEMPPQRGDKAVEAKRLIAVLQGWNVTAEEVNGQINHANQTGAAGYIVALAKIEQGWEPRIFKNQK